MKLVRFAAFLAFAATSVESISIQGSDICSEASDYLDEGANLSQTGAETSAEFLGMLGGTNKPVHCSSQGHLNSPVINIVDKSQKTEHSHAFDPPTENEMKKKLNAAMKGI